MTERKRQTYPKKYLRGKKLLKGKAYICLWIPDTPYTKYPPKPVFYIKNQNMYCRIVLDTPDNLIDLISEIIEFIIKEIDNYKENWKEALKEWEDLHNPEFIEKTKKEIESIYQNKKVY